MSNLNDVLQSVTLNTYLASANQAFAEGNWEESYYYWDYIRLNFPDHHDAILQTATVLYKLQDYDVAALLAREFLELSPKHYQAQVLLGDIAFEQGNWRLAYHYWDALTTQDPNQPAGHLKLAKLAEINNPAKALELWNELGKQFPKLHITVAKAITNLYIKYNYWHMAKETAYHSLQTHRNNPNSYLLALTLNLRYIQQHDTLQFETEQHLLFIQCAYAIKKFPDNLPLQIFEAKLALHFHAYANAHHKFKKLATQHPASIPINTHYAKTLIILGNISEALDVLLSLLSNPRSVESEDYIQLLVSVLNDENRQIWQENLPNLEDLLEDTSATLSLITQLEVFECYQEAMSLIDFALDQTIDELRLLYLKAKVRIQNAICLSSAKPNDDLHTLEQFPSYQTAFAQSDDTLRRAIETHQHLVDDINDRVNNLYLDTHTSAYQTFKIATDIIDAIKSNTPFSLVRSDGYCLPYTDEDEKYHPEDKTIYENSLWNGNPFNHQREFEQALINADILGIPEHYHEAYLDYSDLALHRRLRGILSWTVSQPIENLTITSSQINHDLQIWGLYDLILSHVDAVSIITPTSIADNLMCVFGIGTRTEYLIPRDYSQQTPLDPEPNTPHYPERFDAVCTEIDVTYAGEVFLVNAGILSPIYCDIIKNKGGIALDIGETATLWNNESPSLENINPEILPFYRIHRTSLWWNVLNAVENIPFQNLITRRATTYWINLSHRTDRRIMTRKNLNHLNIPHHRIEATTPDGLPKFRIRPDQLNLLDVEQACVASHMSALERGVEDANPIFFVREDDLREVASVDYDHLLEKAPAEWDILQLHTHGIETLQHNYLAYLAGHMWLPWNWHNPSTAFYLANTNGAKKILNYMNYSEDQSVDLRLATPNLPVADRALYKDFRAYTSTYPFAFTDNSESDILNVNVFRHNRASNLIKRFHIMTHADNPQLCFHTNHTTIQNDNQQNIIMGMGASTSGFSILQRLLSHQMSSFISNQMGHQPYRFPEWHNDANKVLTIINYILETRDCQFVGDIMSAYLPYAESLISLDPTIKFVCMYCTEEDEINSLLHMHPHTNIFQNHDDIRYQKNTLYDHSVPKYDPQMTKVEAIKQHVKMYHETSSILENKYPSNVRRFNILHLDDAEKVFELLTWAGYSNPKIGNNLSTSAEMNNPLKIQNFAEIVLTRESSSLFLSSEHQNQFQKAKATDTISDPNLYKIEILKGRSSTKEFINFLDEHSAHGNIPLHIDFRRDKNLIGFNNYVNSSWGKEKGMRHNYAKDSVFYAYYDTFFHCIHLLNEKFQLLHTFEFASPHQITHTKVVGRKIRLESSQYNLKNTNLWRFSRRSSGFHALPEAIRSSKVDLKRGLSIIIRAKNEEATIERCLTSILPHVDEVIFVDNGSTDQTRLIAERLQQKYFNLKVYSYPFHIPRIGKEHSIAVQNNSTNTLGHYYNWCLAQSTMVNFAKWDADYICIEENFAEMVNQFQLRTRGDNFVLWFSGLELYSDGQRYWIDRNSLHNEYRVFSRKHGAHWVNLPPWEEIEQGYIFRAHKLFYEKPVYIELFRLDEIEFRDRGIFTGNERDRDRMAYIQMFKQTGELPESFIEVAGFDDPKIKDMTVSEFEIQDMHRANKAFNSMPGIIHKSRQETQIKVATQPIPSVFTAIMSCRPNREKQAIQRNTWIQDMRRAGLTYAFIEGDIGRSDCLVDDRLLLNCRDEYEFLAGKTLAIVRWVYYNTNFDYLLKVDDDVILNPAKLMQFAYHKYNYIGGRLISSGFDPLWHTNKTWNPQLSQMYCQIENLTPYYGGQFSYFLSRYAMKTLIDNSQELTTQLYEDYGVAKALVAGGIKPAPVHRQWQSRNYAEWDARPRFDIASVSDIPVDKMYAVYTDWSKSQDWHIDVQRYHDDYDVTFDWMDIPKVFSQLQSK